MNRTMQRLAWLAILSSLIACAPNKPSVAAQPSSDQNDDGVVPEMPISTPGLPQFDSPAFILEAGQITQRFVGTLMPTLQEAMTQGGPLNAIDVCAVEAPRIARQLSEETGWDVGRVSLKARNDSTAMPDAWETQVLMAFDQRQRQGEAGASLNVAETVNRKFRYMQAQPTAPLCLTCHGSEVSAEVISAIRIKYPNDLALGYKVGEIRGAISLARDANEL